MKSKTDRFLLSNRWWLALFALLLLIQAFAWWTKPSPLVKEVTSQMVWRITEKPYRLTENPGQPLRFLARITSAQDDLVADEISARVYCYNLCDTAQLVKGASYQGVMSLLPPNYATNPSNFDYARWLDDRGIQAIAQIRTQPQLVTVPMWFDRLYVSAIDSLTAITEGFANQAVFLALLTGHKNLLTPRQQQLLIDTATMHLLVVSGMHLGLAFGWCLLLLRFIGAGVAWQLGIGSLAMLGYVWLADFHAPAMRALVMALIASWFMLRIHQRSHWFAWLTALVFVAAWQIAFWRDAGVVLSFAAVAVLLHSMRSWRSHHWLRLFFAIQWLLFITLGMLQALLFHRLSLAGFAANLVMVPLMGVLLLPLVLVGALSSLFFPSLGWSLFWLADILVSLAWGWLDWLHELPFASILLPGALLADWQVVGGSILLALAILLPPAFRWGRLVPVLAFLPLIWWNQDNYHQPPPLLLATRNDIYVLLSKADRMLVIAASKRSKPSPSDLRYVLAPALRYAKVRQIEWLALNKGATNINIDAELRQDQRVIHLEYCRSPPDWSEVHQIQKVDTTDTCMVTLPGWSITPMPAKELTGGLVTYSEAYSLALKSNTYTPNMSYPCLLIGRKIKNLTPCTWLSSARLLPHEYE